LIHLNNTHDRFVFKYDWHVASENGKIDKMFIIFGFGSSISGNSILVSVARVKSRRIMSAKTKYYAVT
jgi:hypothetical protein